MQGTIVTVDHRTQRGVIEGQDGKRYPFRRAGMILWLEFDRLHVGTHVSFTAQYERAINVERMPAR
jgi:hypothetical protein